MSVCRVARVLRSATSSVQVTEHGLLWTNPAVPCQTVSSRGKVRYQLT